MKMSELEFVLSTSKTVNIYIFWNCKIIFPILMLVKVYNFQVLLKLYFAVPENSNYAEPCAQDQ